MPTITVFIDGEGVRLDRYLRRVGFYFPQNLFEKWSRQGKLQLNDVKAKASSRLKEGDLVTFPDDAIPLPPPDEVTPLHLSQGEAEALIQPMIVFEDEDLLVLNKPTGLATQGGTNQKTSVDDILRAYSPDTRYRLTHRIDRETSGLLLIAKNVRTATELTNAFRDRTVEKIYRAVCEGIFDEKKGIVDTPIGKAEGSFENMSTGSHVVEKTRRDAITAYTVVAEKDGHSHVELSPKTGRTHQLRVHMADLGHPILGDKKYGGQHAKRLMLHAWKLTFTFKGTHHTFEAPLPKEF